MLFGQMLRKLWVYISHYGTGWVQSPLIQPGAGWLGVFTDLFHQKHEHTHMCSHMYVLTGPDTQQSIKSPVCAGGTATRASGPLTVCCFPDLEHITPSICVVAPDTQVHRWESRGNRWEVHSNQAAQMFVRMLRNAAVLQGAGDFLRSAVILPLTVCARSLADSTHVGEEVQRRLWSRRFSALHCNVDLTWSSTCTALTVFSQVAGITHLSTFTVAPVLQPANVWSCMYCIRTHAPLFNSL